MATDIATRDAVDDLFNGEFSDLDEDPFADKPKAQKQASLKRKLDDGDDKENNGLGLDEEVKIVKKRQPIAKLDEARLLSEPGIPVLRKLVREKRISRKLRLKGKGHEFTDAARLLNYFQLWLDNLYPRAKFADALQLTEKAGHSKRMHMVRNEWINEGKPGYIRPESTTIDVEVTPEEMPDLFTTSNDDLPKKQSTSTEDPATKPRSSIFGNGLSEDSLFIPDSNKEGRNEDANDNEPDEDELDALLAMQDSYDLPGQSANQSAPADDSEGEDDLDALLAEQDTRSKAIHKDIPLKLNSDALSDDNVPDLDLDDLDALMASQESRGRRSNDTTPVREGNGSGASSVQTIPADLDDEDAEDDLTTAIAAAKSRGSASSTKETQVDSAQREPSKSPPVDETIVADGEDSQLKDVDEGNALLSSPGLH